MDLDVVGLLETDLHVSLAGSLVRLVTPQFVLTKLSDIQRPVFGSRDL
jgi:hypothetical protein